MDARPHLLIEVGPDAGREVRIVTAEGMRVGRSSRNDLVLQDPKTSRYHCRFFIKPGDGLCVADLGSANQTLVNQQPVREVRLRMNDRITIGDTEFRVIDEAADGAIPAPSTEAGDASASVDLGLQPAPAVPSKRKPISRARLVFTLTIMALLATAAWLPKLLNRTATPSETAVAPPPPPPPLTIIYEKVIADTERIFRYQFILMPDHKLVVTVDDTDSTHLRESGTLKEGVVADLAATVKQSGFFALEDHYDGIRPNALEQWDLSITLGHQVKRCRVVNREEPPEFKVLREKLENQAQLDLGLWAVQYPPDKLIEMANKAYLAGRKFFDERDVKHGNLAAGIRQLHDAEFFLKSIEPKPDFHPALLALLAECSTELDRRYVDQNFLANRAMRAKNLPEAALELRVLCEILGDRADTRYEEAERALLEVESRLNLEKR